MPSTEDKLRQYLKRVTLDLGEARQRLREAEQRHHEPIAITSMACRYPGGIASPEALWDLVDTRADAIGPFPTNRGWDLAALYHPDPDHPGTSYIQEGGFVHDADEFDASFFNISPREALAMDPQQRLLLETAWELLERAHIDPTALKGSSTGVYTGCGVPGFGTPHIEKSAEGFLLTGNALSVVSGRIAFTLGLEGPAVTLDTACSSSLVAMHLAVQALRQGECDLALAGGVTVMSTPNVITEFSRQRGLAPDGRCKPFATAADGTGFSEGAGLVLLERLSDARRNGHHVLAVIRGSAVNQDGASNGLSAPNGPSQQRVIRQALANAGLAAVEVDAVEAHGTGTTLGDPIEAEALLATYGQERPEDRPLWLGSIKSNIGHTQGAAGIAGVIKMVMALRHGTLPATLHVDEPTSHVDWSSGAVRLLTEPVDWPTAERPRRAGVSAFGISGTNAHVILEEAPEAPEPDTDAAEPVVVGGVLPWVLSARTHEALAEQARRLAGAIADTPGISPTEVAWSLATTRATFDHRAVVTGTDLPGLTAALEALATGGGHPHLVRGAALDIQDGPVFVFPGQGSQWAGMAVGLLDSSPAFASRIAACEKALAPYVDWSLTAVLRGTDTTDPQRVDVVQPTLWAMMVSLAGMWQDFGVTPAAVIGHSQGEIAAACVAGALTLEDAAKVVALRSQALRALAGHGAMASLTLTADHTAHILADLGETAEGIAIAAHNGPRSTVISGPPDQIATVLTAAETQGARTRTIDVDYASHSPHVDRIRDTILDRLSGLAPATPTIPFYSTVTTEPLADTPLDAEYWFTNLRHPVRFADTLTALLAHRHRHFVEVSPHPVLTPGIQDTIDDADIPATTIPTLRRDHGTPHDLADALAHAHTTGLAVNWRPWYPVTPSTTADLPTYPFQRQRHWMAAGRPAGDVSAAGLRPVAHPQLSAATGLADGGLLLTGRLPAAGDAGRLGEQTVGDTVLLPGTALVEWALRAADEAGCGAVEELTLQVPLVLSPAFELRVQVVVDAPDGDGRRGIRVCSQPASGTPEGPEGRDAWTCHATGTLARETTNGTELTGAWLPAGAEPVDTADIAELYARAEAEGHRFGPAFQGVQAVWRHGSDLFAEVTLPDGAEERGEEFGIHPALLEAALHPVALHDLHSDGPRWLPFAWRGVSLHAGGARSVRVRIRSLGREDSGGRELGVVVADATGAPVLDVDTVALRPADGDWLKAAERHAAGGLFTVEWTPLPPSEDRPEPEEAEAGWATLDALPAAARPFGGRRYADLAALLAAVEGGEPAPPVVLATVAPNPDPDADLSAVRHTLGLVQGWLAEPQLRDSRLVLITSGAVAVGDGEGPVDPAGAAVWGLVRAVQNEHPGRFTLVDADADGDGKWAEAVRRSLDADEPQIAVRSGAVSIPRLRRAVEPTDAAAEVDLSGGTVVVSGGTDPLGGAVAEHLVRAYGVARVLLLSPGGGQDPEAAAPAERLTALGAEAKTAAVDVADRSALAEVLASVPESRPLVGVVHLAGAADGAPPVESWDDERLTRAWAPATEAWHLHTLTRDLPLRLFVVVSSAADLVGGPGRAGHAAANARADALISHRRAAGLPGLSVAWALEARAASHAPRLLDAAFSLPHPAVVAADLDTARSTAAAISATVVPALLRAPVRSGRRRAAERQSASPALAARLAGLDASGQRDLLLEMVRQMAAVVLGHSSDTSIRPEAAFKELGFDSLMAVGLRNRLSDATGLRLPSTLVFDYPTPQTLAGHLLERLTATASATASPLIGRGRSARAADDDPIAVVAMACRFPGGVTSPEGLWDLVSAGEHVVGPFPTNRGWDLANLFHPDSDHPGTSYASEGAFIYDVEGFDAAFFGINPREALAMDPQQRLVLETAWEALERAGIDPHTLKDSLTGVYTGVIYHDYATGLPAGDPRLDGYTMLSTIGSIISGRVAYTLGLQGPAVTVDTACSSSLVSMHLAAQALRQGECDLALAGGVTVMATPDPFTGFSRQRGLAPDGRCKPFAAAADGTSLSEGAGLVLLERLSDARRNGHRVLAVVRGSAINQDGASNGLTAPNGPSQQRVIAQALAGAGLTTADIDAVEAHGTGTTLGDPIEAQAILATYGQDRPDDRPLWLGSVKSNIGHTQAASGIAGVIKMISALRHGQLPASLHIDEPSPHIDWADGNVRLLTEPVGWPDTGRPRRAAVSSFGASGTNAHLILEQAPDLPEPRPASDTPLPGPVPWPLSARDDRALREQAAALAEHLAARPDLPVGEVGWSLATTRAVFERRAVIVGDGREELTAALEALAGGEPHPGLATPGGAAPDTPGKTVWLFSGQGSQRPGMGAELHRRFPVFAGAFDEVCALLDPHLDRPLRDVVFATDPELGDLIHHTTYTQAGLFALHIALARLLTAMGLAPDAVAGHSIGEISAAHLAGVLSLEDAAHLVATRATLMGNLPAGGAMATVNADEEEVAATLADFPELAIAAMNTPGHTVISGPADQVATVTAVWRDRGRRTRSLPVSHAFHSPQMEPILTPFAEAIGHLDFRLPRIPLISNLTGEPADEDIATPDYWARHIRRPVRFHQTITHLAADTAVFLELGPAPVLTHAVHHTLPGETTATALATLTGKQSDVRALAHGLASLHTTRAPLDWTPWYPTDPAPRVVELPTYRFQRRPYWIAPRISSVAATGLDHPLLDAAAPLADGGLVLGGRIPAADHDGWLTEHTIAGTVLLPGTALLELALSAAEHTDSPHVEELLLQHPLVLHPTGPLDLQVVVGADDDDRRSLAVYTRPQSGPAAEWTRHATATLSGEPAVDRAAPEAETAWPPPGAEPVDITGFYDHAAADGYDYGPAFQGLQTLWRHGDDLLAEIALPTANATDATGHPAEALAVHPAFLDSALHPLVAVTDTSDGKVWLPFSWNGVTLHATGATHARVRITSRDSEHSLTLTDATGRLILTAEAVTTRPMALDAPQKPSSEGLFTLEWTPASPLADEATPASRAVFAEAPVAEGDGELEPIQAALTQLQEWLAEPRPDDARLVMVTRNAVAVDEETDVDPVAAAVWGLVRSAQTENPGRFVLLDTDTDTDPESDSQVADAVRCAVDLDEPQVALRGGRILVPRLVRATASATLVPPVGQGAWRLDAAGTTGTATLDSVAPVPFPEAEEELAPGRVRIEVRAAGVNFRDVLISLGMVPDQTRIGGEGAGVVLEVAPDVTTVVPGDRVLGVFDGAFAPVTVADARMVTRMPEAWDFSRAAAVPVAFLTAWYGLVELGRLRAGESVLVHAAAGGVGMAAVQIARHLGAEVYATASPGKHHVLEAMGIDETHRASSRDLDFENAFPKVDVVLNSLAGDFIDASLRLLADGGRFLEMGKTDLRDPEQVAKDFAGVDYRVYDLVSDAGPERVARMLATLVALFDAGALTPPPVQTWPLPKARQALRHMSQAKHTGKVVLTIPPALDPNGTVLITGGTGTLGALIAEHLVTTHHITHLHLLSRRGPDAPGAQQLTAKLTALGATVHITATDTSDLPALRQIIDTIDPAHPLTGVIHTAGTVDDAMITSQTPDTLHRVWAAKATGAANLHRATEHLPLAMFALFSSVSGTLGNPGQANYAAANAYCDALASRRQHAGLPAASIAWGLWAATSDITGQLSEADVARIGRTGVTALATDHALALFDAAHRHGDPQLVALNLDVRALAAQPIAGLPPALRALTARPSGATRRAAAATQRPDDWTRRLAGLPEAEQRQQLLTLVRGHAATVLGHADAEGVREDAPFTDLGFDSLTGVELRNRLSAATGLRLPAALVFDFPSARALADHLRGLLVPDGGSAARGGVDPVLGELAKLESTLSALELPEADARAVTDRLEGLLAQWKAASAPPAEDSAADRLTLATADEVLAFIDNELGTS
ncbi:SDR family NAD(P)-dependent oxidoreductase [Streptomyces sp. DSM 41529]|uniref:SDR family NAD(P)-dependent oxidoreductase n=1 Tax=Streptomyces lonegramiae TaxID=3075524 RepID=A0ABU2XIR0_9ACTN|nr:SDR family NAD(P)-dependent oxidoreductase [Streptomyces sp. DSM 41529]MDT0544783.1 SDR family NAD(P)-dependent oxidoreductase [Streptomyces sp. DSM 41529]